MSYPFSTRYGTNKNTNVLFAQPFSLFKTHFYDHLVEGNGTLSLLEAPPTTRNSQWKLRSFIYCKAKLCPKLSTHSATSLISVGYHFDMSSRAASVQTQTYMDNFNSSFVDVDKLSPLAYFNLTSIGITSQVCLKRRPVNVI